MRPAELKAKVNKMIDERIKARGSAELAWLIKELVAECALPANGHNEPSMAFIAAREGFRNTVGKTNRGRKAGLPSFYRIQRAYSMSIGGDNWIVPFWEMMIPDLMEKERQLSEMRHGLTEHMAEIRRLIRELLAHPELKTVGDIARVLYGYFPYEDDDDDDDEDPTSP